MDGGGNQPGLSDGGPPLRQNYPLSLCKTTIRQAGEGRHPTSRPTARHSLNVFALAGDGWSLSDAIRIGTLLSDGGRV